MAVSIKGGVDPRRLEDLSVKPKPRVNTAKHRRLSWNRGMRKNLTHHMQSFISDS